MNAESTPVKDDSNFTFGDGFDEVTPIAGNNFERRKRKHLGNNVEKEDRKDNDSDDESDLEPVIKSQVQKSYKKRKSKENEKRKTDKRTFFTQGYSECQNYSDDLIRNDENFYVNDKSQFCSSKIQFFDSGIDKLLVNVNYDLDNNVETFNGSSSFKKFINNSKLHRNKLSNENLSVSDVMKWNDNSFMLQPCESYFSNLIKKKLFENAQNKKAIKSQTSGWTQYELLSPELNTFEGFGPFHGLPFRVQQIYEEDKGIKELFTWQQECLNLDAVKLKKNLLYSLPTSGGKSLVAEILILKEILIYRKNVLLILPYVSLVQEKIRDFSQFALEFNFSLEEYAAGKGVIPPKRHRKKKSLMVATIEKALIIVNSLIEANRLGEIGMIVVDELHILSEESRGPTLETLLIEAMHFGGNIQIIAMTATIGNLEEVAKFLKAESYSGNFRPVHVLEYVKCENKIYSIDLTCEECLKEERTLDSSPEDESDGIAQLVQEVVPEDSVLVFCPTKKSCENVAALLSHYLPKTLLKHKEEEKTSLYRALFCETNEKICPILKQTLPVGVAYHHSGLTAGERKLLEEAFRQGTLSVICCTSTLAVGVNLPAKRVILRSPYVGKDFITLSKYKQMVGRAGRTGFGTDGDSFLICQPIDSGKVALLFRSRMDETISQMDTESCKGLILSSIGLGIANTRESLKNLLKCSLLHYQCSKVNKDTEEMVDQSIQSLYQEGALSITNKETDFSEANSVDDLDLDSLEGGESIKLPSKCHLTISRLGRAAMKGGLNLEAAHELYGELVKAQASLVLLTSLHLLYLVTPYDLMTQIKPNFQVFFNVYMKFNEREIHAARVIGITESVVTKLAIGAKPKNIKDTVLNRFYISLILNELWKQKTIWDVAQIFQMPRGLVQSIMTSAATFVNSTLRFCEELEEFWAFKSLFSEFSPRLAHCCAPELLPLLDLPAVKKGRAKQLYEAGFKTLETIACAQPGDLVRALDHMPCNVARKIVAAAKLLLMEKAESLQEEAEIVLEGLTKTFAPKVF